jgi:hypothetical protein
MPTDAKFRALLVNKDGERQSLAITELAEAAPIWQPPRTWAQAIDVHWWWHLKQIRHHRSLPRMRQIRLPRPWLRLDELRTRCIFAIIPNRFQRDSAEPSPQFLELRTLAH